MKNLFLIFVLFISQLVSAQSNSAVEMMHDNGKLYVVLAVVLIILVGLFVYLFITERSIKNLEEKLNNK